ncbi:unnamed protein product [marine sediment metagenome]|uniref:Uncharacterized protein n=1 Tax=marine sediment metagenome TaxID=412755 RepID=X1EY67_9ZZZZ
MSSKEKYEEFHKNASIQTKVVDSKNFTYHIVLSFIDKYLQPDMKVLDIGCGVGTISIYVANKKDSIRNSFLNISHCFSGYVHPPLSWYNLYLLIQAIHDHTQIQD